MRLRGSEICMMGLIPIFHSKLRRTKVPRGTSNGRDGSCASDSAVGWVYGPAGGGPHPRGGPDENEAPRVASHRFGGTVAWTRCIRLVRKYSLVFSLFMWTYPQTFDVIVIGAGHAGIEASAAAARLGCDTLLLTQNLDTIGQMSCNPAIGGLTKGHMVREIDALGGVMAENCDATGIQFRMLNANKGPSVRAPRAQCDKKAYQFRMKALLESTPHLRLMQGNVAKLLVTPDGVE